MGKPVKGSQLTKRYVQGRVEVKAVSSVDLELAEGEIVGLVGPSGSGKTTLLSMLGCILRPTEGSLHVFGTEITGLSEAALPAVRRKYVSFIFQGFNLFPPLTAYENIMLILGLKRVDEATASDRAKSLLSQVGLSERTDFLPRDLSGGEKQRVAVARALASDSPLILADEPTGNLDHVNGRKVMALLRSLAVEQGKTVVVATHDNRVEDMFNRILVMEDGMIRYERKLS